MAQQTPLYIVASPRPRVGKTVLARLLVEFFGSDNRALAAYDLNPRDPALAGYFPKLVTPLDIAETRGQMMLFDQLIGRRPVSRVIDVGYGAYDQFFAVMAEIGFVREARRRAMEPVVLFAADRAAMTVRAYAELRHGLPDLTVVPVHNEFVSVTCDKDDFPPSRTAARMIRIPRLSQMVRGVIDRPSFSFAAYMAPIPGTPTEIHGWVADIFAQFRELELRLLMGTLAASLARGGGAGWPTTERF